ncbi:hypothetical protein AGOR_G00019450 [Albula goreensis]|uniref:A-kinase anchor protein 14 n=1 Tax=Albula goreensis TaxID=1534307 RepID=A0A8T3E0H4_9TELE|nr:hypothetical protein AGOR_G00019450 [Albula goreensis]
MDSSTRVNRKSSETENTSDNPQDTVTHEVQEETDLDIHEIKNIDWVTCSDFTIHIGKKQIEQYIRTWELDPAWLFSSEFLQERELKFKNQYHYKLQWSIPTQRTPIPKATACVYFVIEISTIKPKSLPVEVYYLVESCRLRHRPGKTRFRGKWLTDIIESKSHLQDTVSF